MGQNLQKVVMGPERAKVEDREAANLCLLLPQFSGQEQNWWIGLHTSENDGRFRWERWWAAGVRRHMHACARVCVCG